MLLIFWREKHPSAHAHCDRAAVFTWKILNSRDGRRLDMQLQEVQEASQRSGLGHLLFTYPKPGPPVHLAAS